LTNLRAVSQSDNDSVIMKKYLLLFGVLLALALDVTAQMHISTSLRRDAVFNLKTQTYDLIGEDHEELTFFDFNQELTMFKHTTPSITSAYIIKSTVEDKEHERWEFDVISDVGNKYLMILDVKNNNIRFIAEREDGTYLVQHTIKKIWFDE